MMDWVKNCNEVAAVAEVYSPWLQNVFYKPLRVPSNKRGSSFLSLQQVVFGVKKNLIDLICLAVYVIDGKASSKHIPSFILKGPPPSQTISPIGFLCKQVMLLVWRHEGQENLFSVLSSDQSTPYLLLPLRPLAACAANGSCR